MNRSLAEETEKLIRSWAQHQEAWLRDYLVSGVEDPRINIQSILSRHFILQSLTAERFGALMQQECRFGAVMNWLQKGRRLAQPEELDEVLYALRRGMDNAEGLPIPQFVLETFSGLGASGTAAVPNYIENLVAEIKAHKEGPISALPVWDTFMNLWNEALASGSAEGRTGRAATSSAATSGAIDSRGASSLPRTAGRPLDADSFCRSATKPTAAESPGRYPFGEGSEMVQQTLSVVEPACGSANDFRFLCASGIGRLIRYCGFDLCEKNVENARKLFPDADFRQGNVFEIAADDRAFDICFVHDLFEHLSLEGLAAAVEEVCRVTRWGICAGFFNMDEVPDHRVQPVEEYHWNQLSMERMRELFQSRGFDGQIIHVGTFLRRQLGCEETHNPNAYTFLLQARR